jgi:hypothetical protein
MAEVGPRTSTGALPSPTNTFIPATKPKPVRLIQSLPSCHPTAGDIEVTAKLQEAVSTQAFAQHKAPASHPPLHGTAEASDPSAASTAVTSDASLKVASGVSTSLSDAEQAVAKLQMAHMATNNQLGTEMNSVAIRLPPNATTSATHVPTKNQLGPEVNAAVRFLHEPTRLRRFSPIEFNATTRSHLEMSEHRGGGWIWQIQVGSHTDSQLISVDSAKTGVHATTPSLSLVRSAVRVSLKRSLTTALSRVSRTRYG